MYQQFFNFTEPPFSIAPDPHFIYMSRIHKEGLAHLLYGINYAGGFVALTGEVGTGKTTLCQCLLQPTPDNVDIALVLNPKLNAIDLLATLCDELSIPYNHNQNNLKYLVDKLNHYLLTAHARRRRTILIIDEAQNLDFEVLEQIRLLTNLETRKQKLLQIILIGQPELKLMLASPQLRQLNQRITARYHLFPLNNIETCQYIRHRLVVSHGNPDIFNQAAIRLIFQISKGIPRLINLICDRALLGAYANNTRKVTKKIIDQATREIDPELLNRPSKLRLLLLLVIFMGSLLFAIVYHFPELLPENPEKQADVTMGKNTPLAKLQTVKSRIIQPRHSLPLFNPLPAFTNYLQTTQLPLKQAFDQLAKLWGVPGIDSPDCNQLPLNCLQGKTSWPELIAMQRPVIMEFTVDKNEKRFLLLLAVNKTRPVFFTKKAKISFPLNQVLSIWQGHYLLFWQSPFTTIETVYPHQHSPAVAWLKKQLGLTDHINPTDYSAIFYDETLIEKIKAFQRSRQLNADGIAGPRTLIHLQNINPSDHAVKLLITD